MDAWSDCGNGCTRMHASGWDIEFHAIGTHKRPEIAFSLVPQRKSGL